MCVLWLLLLVVKFDWLLLYVEVGGREQQQHTKKKQSNKTKKIIVHRNNKRNILENFYGIFFSFFCITYVFFFLF